MGPKSDEYWKQFEEDLAVLIEQREREGTSPELSWKIHDMQRKIWAHKNQAGGLQNKVSRRVFGKPIREFTPEEMRAYHKELYGGGGYVGCKTREVFGKPISEMTEDEHRAYANYLYKERAKKKGD